MTRYALALALALAACTSSSLPAGAACSGSGADCGDLSCLPFGQFAGSACTVVGNMCTKTCGSNGDCAALGSNFICFASCEGAMVCGAAQP